MFIVSDLAFTDSALKKLYLRCPESPFSIYFLIYLFDIILNSKVLNPEGSLT